VNIFNSERAKIGYTLLNKIWDNAKVSKDIIEKIKLFLVFGKQLSLNCRLLQQ